jgi:hypothetical protein
MAVAKTCGGNATEAIDSGVVRPAARAAEAVA